MAHDPLIALEEPRRLEDGLVVLALERVEQREDVVRAAVRLQEGEEHPSVAEPDERGGHGLQALLLQEETEIVERHRSREEPRRISRLETRKSSVSVMVRPSALADRTSPMFWMSHFRR